MDITIINSYKIINTIDLRPYAKLRKHSSHRLFRMKLIQKLYNFSVRIAKLLEDLQHYTRKKLIQLIRYIPSEKHEKRVQLNETWHYCVPCSIADRIARKLNIKKPLQNLSLNNLKVEQRRQ